MIFTLFITCIFGLGALQASCAAPRTNEIQVVESKKRNNLFNKDGYACMTLVEYLTRPETYCYYSDAFFSKSNVGDSYLVNIFYSSKLVSWFDVRYSNLAYTYQNATNRLDDLVFTLSRFITRNQTRLQEWTATFYDLNNDTYVFNLEIAYAYDQTDPSITLRDIIGVTYLGTGNSSGDLSSVIIADNYSDWLDVYTDSYSYNRGYQNGYIAGNNAGYDEGYEQGEIHGKDIAQDPSSEIYETIYDTGYSAGQQAGYSTGYSDASADSGVPATIFSGILSVALIPVNVFIQMFQYEVFGINIAGLVSALITIAMVIIIVRFLLGGKTDDK